MKANRLKSAAAGAAAAVLALASPALASPAPATSALAPATLAASLTPTSTAHASTSTAHTAKAQPAATDSGESTPLNLGSSSTTAGHGSGGGSILRTLIGLVIVIAVIYGVSWILRQVKGSRDTRSSGRGLTSVATLPLGTGRSLHLVRAGRELVLVGVAEHGVTPIRRYDEDEARAAGFVTPDDERADGGAGPTGLGGGSTGGWVAGDGTEAPLARALGTLRRWTVRS